MSVSDGVVGVFSPPSLVVVLKARIGFYEGGETEQANDPGKPVTAHAQGRRCATAPVRVPADDSSQTRLARILVRLCCYVVGGVHPRVLSLDGAPGADLVEVSFTANCLKLSHSCRRKGELLKPRVPVTDSSTTFSIFNSQPP